MGEDGPTHAGAFDISFLRCIPNMIIATPSCENSCRQLLFSAYDHAGPSAVRYPRGTGQGATIEAINQHWPVGKAHTVKDGQNVCILNFGVLLPQALDVATKYNYGVCDMRWAKPLDMAMIDSLAKQYSHFVTLEENAIAGGAGAGVLEYLSSQGHTQPTRILGLADNYLEHGTRSQLLHQAGLDTQGIDNTIQTWLDKLG